MNVSVMKTGLVLLAAASIAAPAGAAPATAAVPAAFLPADACADILSITEGISRVLKDSRLIRISLPDREMAFEDTLIARSALFPHLSASASKSFYRYQPASKSGSSVIYTQEQQPFSFGVDLYQTLYDFGKSLANYRAAKEVLSARQANLESVRRMAVLEFVTAYFDLLQSEKMIEVAEKEVESVTAYLGDIQHLYEQGVVVKNDLLPAQVRLADARQRLIAARNGREIAAAELNNLLALPLTRRVGVRDIEMTPPELPPIEEAWRLAAGQRSELALVDGMARASEFNEKAKARENWPTIYAQGDYTSDQNKYLLHDNNAVVKVGAKVNLYEGGSDRAELRKEQALRAQLGEQREKLLEDIKLEVETGYVGLRNAGERVVVAKDALAQADENVRVSRVKYAEGIATSTEVLEAITLQTGARTNFYSADYEMKRAYSRLMYSIGVDLSLVYERMESGHHERAD